MNKKLALYISILAIAAILAGCGATTSGGDNVVLGPMTSSDAAAVTNMATSYRSSASFSDTAVGSGMGSAGVSSVSSMIKSKLKAIGDWEESVISVYDPVAEDYTNATFNFRINSQSETAGDMDMTMDISTDTLEYSSAMNLTFAAVSQTQINVGMTGSFTLTQTTPSGDLTISCDPMTMSMVISVVGESLSIDLDASMPVNFSDVLGNEYTIAFAMSGTFNSADDIDTDTVEGAIVYKNGAKIGTLEIDAEGTVTVLDNDGENYSM